MEVTMNGRICGTFLELEEHVLEEQKVRSEFSHPEHMCILVSLAPCIGHVPQEKQERRDPHTRTKSNNGGTLWAAAAHLGQSCPYAHRHDAECYHLRAILLQLTVADCKWMPLKSSNPRHVDVYKLSNFASTV